ncbi:MAG: hypothetical protein RR400_00855 [Clostridia bacterium]
MLDKKERAVLLFLIENCKADKVALVKAENIILEISKNNVLSLANLNEIMLSLDKDNFIDYVPSDSKTGCYYCVSLKKKAQTFKRDLKKQKKERLLLFGRTVILAMLSFAVGCVLKMIFW